MPLKCSLPRIPNVSQLPIALLSSELSGFVQRTRLSHVSHAISSMLLLLLLARWLSCPTDHWNWNGDGPHLPESVKYGNADMKQTFEDADCRARFKRDTEVTLHWSTIRLFEKSYRSS